MIDRYTSFEMKTIWSQENKLNQWLNVEIQILKALAKQKLIPIDDVNKIVANAKVDVLKMEEIEKKTKHDVAAFVEMISLSLGSEKKWFHYGITSTDIVDTAYGVLFKQANSLIEEKITSVIQKLKKLALEYAYTPCIGRTHGVHAEITSLGLKFALWYDEMKRNYERFKMARSNVEQGKISGAVGNFAHIKPFVQDYVCQQLKINSALISTQVISRDHHAFYYVNLAIIASSLEKFATEIRSLQRTEIGEVQEFFQAKQKGSSAMPHKQNPIASENICGQSRLLRAYAQAALENNNLWHERDISHSSVERNIAPSATSTIEYMLKRFNSVIASLKVNKQKMLDNIWLTKGTIFSQKVMLYLVEKKNWNRQKAYELVQKLAFQAYHQKASFKDVVAQSKEFNFTTQEVNNLFDYNYYLQEVDNIFKRLKIK